MKWYPKESVFKEFLAVASAAPFPMLQPGCIHRVSPTICTAFAQAVPTASLLGYSPLIIGLKPWVSLPQGSPTMLCVFSWIPGSPMYDIFFFFHFDTTPRSPGSSYSFSVRFSLFFLLSPFPTIGLQRILVWTVPSFITPSWDCTPIHVSVSTTQICSLHPKVRTH